MRQSHYFRHSLKKHILRRLLWISTIGAIVIWLIIVVKVIRSIDLTRHQQIAITPSTPLSSKRQNWEGGQFSTYNETDIYRSRTINPHHYDIQLFWKNPDTHELFQQFQTLNAYLRDHQQTLLFATNAGMFHRNGNPVGLHIASGQILHAINLKDGEGNFFLKPNGVFFIDNEGYAHIMESNNFYFFRKNKMNKLKLATQSGPLLLYGGTIHPYLNPSSPHKFIRSGIGIDNNGNIVFVITKKKLTFYEFALLFRDKMQCKKALYLDGQISETYDINHGTQQGKYNNFVGILGAMKQ